MADLLGEASDVVLTAFDMRDPETLLHFKFLAEEHPELASRIAAKHGVRYSILDSQPDWFGSTSCPGEPMHAFFLGELV